MNSAENKTISGQTRTGVPKVSFATSKSPMIDRLVEIVREAGSSEEHVERRFSSFSTSPNIVLLGDPGAGKTYLFLGAAALTGAQFVTTRSFLNLPPEHLADHIFIDALDEQRSGPADNATIDQIVRKLFEANPTRVRISCRSQDWLGDTDLAAFKDYFAARGGVTVLSMRPIERAEQVEILISEGASGADANAFLDEAERRNMAAFTRNARKMVLLFRVVGAGNWPATVGELFSQATRLQLTEAGNTQANYSGRQFTADKLRGTAGGICAARLIADIEGISLNPSASSEALPTSRSLEHLDAAKVDAALRRSLFISTSSSCVDYDHRTSAEFLAAEWLATAVRAGLPVGRVQALLGVDDRPAAELRGLHAWLPYFLPEHAETFIHADPLGILEYGDPASLSPAMRTALLAALGAMATDNPWFLSFQRHPAGLAALVQNDSIDTLCNIIDDDSSPRDLRTIALEALETARPRQEAFNTLRNVLANGKRHWHDRLIAMRALLLFGETGFRAILDLMPSISGDTEDRLRLRAAALEKLYGHGVGPEDVVVLANDLISSNVEGGIGLFWALADGIAAADLATVLDRLADVIPERTDGAHRRSAWETASFVNRMIARVASETPGVLNGIRVLKWIDVRQRLKRLGADERDKEFILSVRSVPGLAQAAFNAFIDALEVNRSHPGRVSMRYGEVVGPLAPADEACEWALSRLMTEANPQRREFVFDLALQYARSREINGGNEFFERLYALGEQDDALRPVLQAQLVCNLDWWLEERNYRVEAAARKSERKKSREETLSKFSAAREQVREGKHAGWLGFAAEIYFDWYGDVDHEAAPKDRLASYFGAENAAAALQGFASITETHAVPTIEAINKLFADDKFFPWWWALAAAVDARVRENESVADLAPELVEAVLTIDLRQMLASRVKRGDKETPSFHEVLRSQHPEIATRAYLRSIRKGLGDGEQHPTGLYQFIDEPIFSAARHDTLLSLLDEFALADPRALEQLLQAALADPELHIGLYERALSALANVELGPERSARWRATAFLIQPLERANSITEALALDAKEIWPLRDFLGFKRHRDKNSWPLPIEAMSTVALACGAVWPPADYPSDGWGGNQNPWDAADFVRSLINRISASPSAIATDALQHLLNSPAINAYHNHIRYALAQQRVTRREAEYDRPDWGRTLQTLANKTPANAADLHALTIDHLRDLSKEIDGDTADVYRQFWNETGHGVLQSPKPEESCRDALVKLLRPRLAPFGLTVEPEAHAAVNKRVDIAIARAGLKLVVEVKLAHSPDVWTAMVSQLDGLYTRDPETKGFGVLLVFWFGTNSPKGITTEPKSGDAPASAIDFEKRLTQSRTPPSRLAAVVLDASGHRSNPRSDKRA